MSEFVLFVAVLGPAYAVNAISAPGYFASLGVGDIRWNIRSHLLAALVNVALGWLLGHYWLGIGVVIGSALAMLLGSVVSLIGNHRTLTRSWSGLVPPRLGLLIVSGICVSILVIGLRGFPNAGKALTLGVPAVAASLISIVSLMHPTAARLRRLAWSMIAAERLTAPMQLEGRRT